MRDTALGDSEVGCFSCTKTLTHLYLECPSSLRNAESSNEIRTLQREDLNQLPVYEDGILAQVCITCKDYIIKLHINNFYSLFFLSFSFSWKMDFVGKIICLDVV